MNNRKRQNISDYYFYSFEITKNPLTYIFSRKKQQQFVFTELEKQHPFFGPHCTVTYKLCLHNKKLCIKSSVIDTIVLAKKEKKIVTEKAKLLYCSLFILLFVGLLCTCLLPFTAEKTVSPITQHITNNQVIKKPRSSITSFLSLIESLLDNNDGSSKRCTSFIFSENSVAQNTAVTAISVGVEGIFPEDIFAISTSNLNSIDKDAISVSEVHFENNIPSMTISFSEQNTIDAGKETKSESDFYLINSVLRNLIVDSAGMIHTEDTVSRFYDFSIPVIQWDDFYKNFLVFLDENMIGISQVSFVLTDDFVQASVSLQMAFGHAERLYVDNLFYLIDTKKSSQNENTDTDTETISFASNSANPPNAPVPSIPAKKIGSITRANGDVVIFCLNNEGKVISEEKK